MAANAVAVVLLVTAWYQCAGTGTMRTGLAWLNLALVALGLAGTYNGLFVVTVRRSVRRARHDVVGRIAGRVEAPAALDGVRMVRTGDERRVATSEMVYYHRERCRLVLGKDVAPSSVEAHRSAGRQPCPVCEP